MATDDSIMWRRHSTRWVSKAALAHAHAYAPAHPHTRKLTHTYMHPRTHTEVCTCSFLNAPKCYVIRALPVLFDAIYRSCRDDLM